MSFKSGFERRERKSQFNTAGGSELQVRGAAVLNDHLANDVCRNGTHSSRTDDDRVLRVLVVMIARHCFPRIFLNVYTIVADVACRRHLRSVCQNGLMVPRHKLSSAGWRAFIVAAPSVWNSLADYLPDPAL